MLEHITARLPSPLVSAIRHKSEIDGVRMSEIIRRAIAEYVERHPEIRLEYVSIIDQGTDE
jgi:predicted DNA binding CopG/RHH family protein